MIFVTCDVHQMDMQTKEHAYLSKIPTLLAEKYTSICLSNNLKHTYFYTGKALQENPVLAKELILTNYVEIGGHTYSAFRYNNALHKLRVWSRSKYHLFPFQYMDIYKTANVFRSNGFPQPVSWRTHSYRSDYFTPVLLRLNGFRYISDEKKRDGKPYKTNSGIISVPINVMPDHEHLIHGPKCELGVNDRKWEGDCFGNVFLEKEHWADMLLKQIYDNEKSGVDSVILIHAECMDALDKMNTFEAICKELKSFSSGFIRDIVVP